MLGNVYVCSFSYIVGEGLFIFGFLVGGVFAVTGSVLCVKGQILHTLKGILLEKIYIYKKITERFRTII